MSVLDRHTINVLEVKSMFLYFSIWFPTFFYKVRFPLVLSGIHRYNDSLISLKFSFWMISLYNYFPSVDLLYGQFFYMCGLSRGFRYFVVLGILCVSFSIVLTPLFIHVLLSTSELWSEDYCLSCWSVF